MAGYRDTFDRQVRGLHDLCLCDTFRVVHLFNVHPLLIGLEPPCALSETGKLPYS